MKKLLALTLATLMFFSITACNTTKNNIGSNSDNTQNTVNNSEGDGSNAPSDNNPSNNDNAIKIGRILTGYHEGLMFIDSANNIEIHTISCIDKTGKNVFSIEASSIISGFHNGLALVMQEKAVLCDKTGKIITAQELGGTSFDVYNSKIFEDGYILVNKTTTSFQGSVNEMAVFNSDLEKIVDFSSDLYTWCNDDYRYAGTTYYNGYLFDRGITSSVLDLRTGIRSENLAEWVENIELKNESDFLITGEEFEKYYIYDYREVLSSDEYDPKRTPIIDFSETGGRIRSKNQIGTGFVDGYAALVFEVEDSEVDERNYFTIIDESGAFLFEPIETQGVIGQIAYDNGFFVLNTSNGYIEVYNQSGKVATKSYEKPTGSYWYIDFDISDDVIYIVFDSWTDDTKDWMGIYTTNLQPLFDVN